MQRWVIWVIVGVISVAATTGFVVYTEQPAFCPTCHEMQPYHTAWLESPHQDVSCLECHVAPGLGNRLAHKFVALKEVWVHVTGDPKFPMYTAEVPDGRCTECHETVELEEQPQGFSHEAHAAAGACQGCHASAGHAVTTDALRSVGVLSESIVASLAGDVTGRLTMADPEPAPAAGHEDTGCDRCHDIASATCDYCHMPPEEHFPGTACTSCHAPASPFDEAKFDHAGDLDCTDCHEPPDNHFTGTACTACHAPDTPFEDAVFVHSGDLDCTDCHAAPANHFAGAACTACHSPDIPFERATFAHPSVGEEHTSRSFPCVDCHPSGYGSATCVKCHEGGNPEDDGDDD